MTANKEMVESIRNRFLAIAHENGNRFHSLDVDKIKSDDWTIERFVLVNKTEGAAFKALVKAMEWRKSFGVNDFTDDYFPQEIYKIGDCAVYCNDKEGRPIVWFRNDRHHKSSQLDPLIRQFLVYNFEKADRQTKNEGWAFVADSLNAGLTNLDMDFSEFLVEVLQSYYPRGVKYMAVVDLPWILSAAAKMIVAFMNQELRNCVKFIKNEELVQYMDSKYIPVHLNGTYDEEISVTPAGVNTLEQLSHTKLSAEQIKKIRKTFEEELK